MKLKAIRCLLLVFLFMGYFTPLLFSQDLVVQYLCDNPDNLSQQIKGKYNIINNGDSQVNLTDLKVRYYFTSGGNNPLEFNCYYAKTGKSKVTGTFVNYSDGVYLELGFSSGSLAAGGQTGEVQFAVNKSDWSVFDQTDDYSFDRSVSSFQDYTNVALFQNELNVYGTEPDSDSDDGGGTEPDDDSDDGGGTEPDDDSDDGGDTEDTFKLEAEDYVNYNDTTAGNTGGSYKNDDVDIEVCNEGGYNVGWIDSGEWLEYNLTIPEDSDFDINVRVANNGEYDNGSFHLQLNNENITDTLTVSSTGGWQTFTNKTWSNINIKAGTYTLRVVMDSGPFNLNWIEFKALGTEPDYTLSALTDDHGTLSLNPGGGQYPEGTIVTLTATGNTGWIFDHWENDLSGTDNPASITIDTDKTVIAVFKEETVPHYTLNALTEGNGTVELNPAGGQYPKGTLVTLTATGNTGWVFDHWENDLGGTANPATITMGSDKTVNAVFKEAAKPWKFIVYGDTRSEDKDHRSVLRSIRNYTPDYKFIVNVGDVVSKGYNESDWDTWQSACDDELGGTGQESVPPKYMSCPGNHEYLDDGGQDNFNKFLPGQKKQYGNNGNFFTVDYENVRIVVLNTEDLNNNDQLAMLNKAINENPKTWLFTVWHRPIFDFGAKGYEENIHNKWGVPLYEGGGDIMFMGHAHYYVRSKKLQLNGEKNPPIDAERGTAQIVTGTGGAPVYDIDIDTDNNRYMVAEYSTDLSYTELTVNGNKLELRQIDTDGKVIDIVSYTANPKNGDNPDPDPGSNIALNKTVKVSSIEESDDQFSGPGAVDGNASTRWASQFDNDPEWIAIDLGKSYDIEHIKLDWEAAFAKKYRIETSNDPSVWTGNESAWITVFEENDSNGDIDDIELIANARYIRLYGIERGTSYGYSLFEIEVYGLDGPPPAEYTLNASTDGNGSVEMNPSGGTYYEGTSVTLTAKGHAGWVFDHWENDLNGTDNPMNIVISADMTLKAIFREGDSEPGIGPVGYYGEMKVSGNRIHGSFTGEPMMVKGMSFFWSNWSDQWYNSGTVDRMYDEFKCEIVRAAYGVDDNGNPQSGSYEGQIDTVVNAAISRGMYVIIDWHSHGANNNPGAAQSFFSSMAQKYGHYDNVIFEVFNEPVHQSWGEIKSYAEGVISEIRNYSDNLIIVGTSTWSQDVDHVIGNSINDSNVAYTLHFYAATHKGDLRSKGDAALNAGLALFGTEWGTCAANGDGGIDYNSTNEWLDWMNQNGISWCNWAINDKPETSSIFDSGGNRTEAGNFLYDILNEAALYAPWR